MNQGIENRSLHTYAEPLAALRVSWGAILAGALAMMGVALILWALALAIVLSVSSPALHAFRGSALALWICGIVTVLAGGFVGGTLSGFLPGNPRPLIGGVHGFLAWAAGFLAANLVAAFALGTVLRTNVMATARLDDTSSEVASPSRAGPNGTVPNEGMARARQMLESLGYTSAQAQAILGPLDSTAAGQGRLGVSRLHQATNVLADWSAGLAWSWFGAWAATAVIATAAGAAATRRTKSIDLADDFPAPAARATAASDWTSEPATVVR